MKLIPYAVAAGLAAATLATPAVAVDITGAGATFPFPVYSKWAEDYKKQTGAGLNYQSIGSGGGIRQIKAKTVDFGATDAPLKGDELEKGGMVQFPTVIGGVVPVVNIQGVQSGQLKLTGEVLADIFRGEIKKWNDPKIAGMNAGVTPARRQHHPGLPLGRLGHDLDLHDLPVRGLAGLEGLARLRHHRELAGRPGRQGQRGRRRDGEAGQQLDRLRRVRLRQAEQHSRTPRCRTRTASSSAPTTRASRPPRRTPTGPRRPGFGISLTNQPGAQAWPITGATFILVYKNPDKPEQTAEVLKFFDWAYKSGDKLATDLDYVPLPGRRRRPGPPDLVAGDQGQGRQGPVPGQVELIGRPER